MIFSDFIIAMSMSASSISQSISIGSTSSLAKKAPSQVIRRGFSVSFPHLIFQGISTLLELAPASSLKRDRLL
jgi:TRAP-type mannitol/chloroaromatic compound transport system permease small subunit